MNTLKVMDVTFRDGGHRTGFSFNDEDLKQVLPALDKARVDYIEVGYRNGIHPVDNNIGSSGYCQRAYLELCRTLIPNVKMAVMAYPFHIVLNDLIELKKCGVDLLRICIPRGELESALKILVLSKDIDLNVSVNFTHTSKYSVQELDDVVKKACLYNPAVIYFADSNGSMIPTKITAIYKRYTQKYTTPFGFHAHDNLGLAQANSIAAINAGAQFVDCSLSGLGKGIGNLRTEFFIAYLKAQHVTHHTIEHLLPAANYIRQTYHTEHDAIELNEFLRGISDL